MTYGPVTVKLRGGKVVSKGTLLDFCTIPVPREHDGTTDMRVFVYGICELESGEFVARLLQDIKRA